MEQQLFEWIQNIFAPTEVDLLVGDATKAKNILGWSPKTSLEKIVKIMVSSDLEKIKKQGLLINKDSTIFVAGASGMVGSAIVSLFKKQGCENILTPSHLTLDLIQQSETDLFFKKYLPEYVFLAAAKVGGILANSKYKADFIYENLMIQNNVIASVKRYKVKKLVFLGSACIYPKYAKQPIKEDELLNGALELTNEPYAIAKIAGIKLCESYFHQYGCDFYFFDAQ